MKLLSLLLMKTRFVLCSFLFISLALHASKKPDTETFTVNIKYSGKLSLSNYPVVVSLKGYPWVSCSSVYFNDKELPSQLDDLDGDGINDEMCFLAELKGGQSYNYKVVLKKQGTQKTYASRTYAELLLRNPKIKEKNKQDLYIQQIEVGKELKDSYHLLHHHGVAFENELIALRIYFDKRQTLDLYGKKRLGLELHETQFYTTKEQSLQGFGDDILWTGNSMGLGALRGWDGRKEQMLEDVAYRGQRIVTQGPVRTIIELTDRGWLWKSGERRICLTERYTLYAGHRDLSVEAWINPEEKRLRFATGLMHISGAEKLSDHKGLRGLWGKNWPSKDTTACKLETLGMGIYVPKDYLQEELACDSINDAYVLAPIMGHLKYYLTYSSDNETYGFHQAQDWFAYLKKWKEQLFCLPQVRIMDRHPR